MFNLAKIIIPIILSITSLAMTNNYLIDDRLIPIIKASTIMDFRYCHIDDNRACSIADIISGHCSHLTQLNLNYNCIGNVGIERFAKALEKTLLTHLELYENVFDDEGANKLFESLKKIPTLLHIDIRGTNIGEGSLLALLDLLKVNPRLKIYYQFKNVMHLLK